MGPPSSSTVMAVVLGVSFALSAAPVGGILIGRAPATPAEFGLVAAFAVVGAVVGIRIALGPWREDN